MTSYALRRVTLCSSHSKISLLRECHDLIFCVTLLMDDLHDKSNKGFKFYHEFAILCDVIQRGINLFSSTKIRFFQVQRRTIDKNNEKFKDNFLTFYLVSNL